MLFRRKGVEEILCNNFVQAEEEPAADAAEPVAVRRRLAD